HPDTAGARAAPGGPSRVRSPASGRFKPEPAVRPGWRVVPPPPATATTTTTATTAAAAVTAATRLRVDDEDEVVVIGAPRPLGDGDGRRGEGEEVPQQDHLRRHVGGEAHGPEGGDAGGETHRHSTVQPRPGPHDRRPGGPDHG